MKVRYQVPISPTYGTRYVFLRFLRSYCGLRIAEGSEEKRTRYRRAGFTIIEVLVAMGILLLGMTAILGMLTFGAALSKTALLRTTSSSVAEAVVADLEETLFPLAQDEAGANGEAGPPIDIRDRPIAGLPEVIYSATAHENPARPLEYRVDIDMTWKSAGVQRERRFSTILLREVPFGERLRRRFIEGGDTLVPSTPSPPAAPAVPKSP